MARYSNRKRHDTGQIITTPSAFGSHKSMVVDHEEFGLELSDNEVLLKDDTHFYITKKDRLDSGLCDTNRYSQNATYEP